MHRVLFAPLTVLLDLNPVLVQLFILVRVVVDVFALRTFELDDVVL